MAVTTAARYVRRTGASPGEYRSLLRDAAEVRLRDKLSSDGPPHVSAALGAVLDTTRDPVLTEVLSVAARFAPEPVPLGLFTDEALPALDRSALVEVTGRSFTVHPLLAEEVRVRTDPGIWWPRAVRTLATAVHDLSFQQGDDLLPHVLAVCRRDRLPAAAKREVGVLLDWAAAHLESRGAHDQARRVGDEATALHRGRRHSRERDRLLVLEEEVRRLRLGRGPDDPATLAAVTDLVGRCGSWAGSTRRSGCPRRR